MSTFSSTLSKIRSVPSAPAWFAIAVVTMATQSASACAVCFGDPDSGMVKGAQAGIIVLAVVAYLVLFSMVGVAGFWAFKARRLRIADKNSQSKQPPCQD